LAFKKTTVVLVPGSTERVRQFRLPKFLLGFLTLVFFLTGTFLGWMIWDYQRIKPQMARLVQLQKENEAQRRQFVYLSRRILEIRKRIRELHEIDRQLRVMVELETSEEVPQFRGIGGSEPNPFPPESSSKKRHRQLVGLMHVSLDQLNHKIAVIKHDKKSLHKYFEDQRIPLSSTPSLWPVEGQVSSDFGYRISPFTGVKEFHEGIDIVARRHTPVITPAEGIVCSVRRERLAGKVIEIDHGCGLATTYAHLQKVLVKAGQYVRRGQKVALVGNTGRSTGPHLHYEVHLNGVPVNPLRYLPNQTASATSLKKTAR
jgi:murein DD-endopeptidase MepM/ murein hydrolase activator NlpD